MAEVSVRINELTVTITNLNNDKRRLEADLANLQAELEEALMARRAAEDRADRTQAELNRLIEELRQVDTQCHPDTFHSCQSFVINVTVLWCCVDPTSLRPDGFHNCLSIPHSIRFLFYRVLCRPTRILVLYDFTQGHITHYNLNQGTGIQQIHVGLHVYNGGFCESDIKYI